MFFGDISENQPGRGGRRGGRIRGYLRKPQKINAGGAERAQPGWGGKGAGNQPGWAGGGINPGGAGGWAGGRVPCVSWVSPLCMRHRSAVLSYEGKTMSPHSLFCSPSLRFSAFAGLLFLATACGSSVRDAEPSSRTGQGKADSLGGVEHVVAATTANKATGGFPAPVFGNSAMPIYHFKRATKIKSASILKVRDSRHVRLLGTVVKVSGYYYDGSIPLVIDDVNRTLSNHLLPPFSYIPLVGRLPALKSGDRITVRAKLLRPTTAMGNSVKYENAVLSVADAGAIQVTKRSTWSAKDMGVEKVTGPLIQPIPPIPYKHAVLIAGGVDGANNHIRYWNDLALMYDILLSSGYDPANIHVLYADGTAVNDEMTVEGMASKANITAVFDALKPVVAADWRSTVFIMINDHGGGFDIEPATLGLHGGIIDVNNDELDPPLSEAALNFDINDDGDKKDVLNFDEAFMLWGRHPTGHAKFIKDDDFADEVDKVNSAKNISIVLEQCYGGGFIEDLTKKKNWFSSGSQQKVANPKFTVANRVIMSAASANEQSYATSPPSNYNEFTYGLMCSFIGFAPGNVNFKFDADEDGDGKTSLVEAYEYSLGWGWRPEMPHFEDNGLVPPVAGSTLTTKEGTLGSDTFL